MKVEGVCELKWSGDRAEGVPPSETTLCQKEEESQTKVQGIQQQRPDSPEPSCLSLKSNWSKDFVIDFKGRHPVDQMIQQQRADYPEPSCLSLKSDCSKDFVIDFKGRHPSADQM
ncbi:NACHT, LRR and PYD domains-containing protein 3-like isoform X1 [Lates japonicus]|uniref:NACHT, LRR and PYD domains-containing protein 3-like isoform X1 n=1 Tax=Lates japonicus TaxID=270547 RepID=A0AAD3MTE9_LATJO|nr:NACHT, LRR and PYD domains-containing protein 3-like isoform X1 [Lates japonicus]